MKVYLKAKVKAIEITGAHVEYEGSLTLDEDIMDRLGVNEYDQVFINSKYGKGRIMTYVMKGTRGTQVCDVNGGAAQYFIPGEVVHLLFFAMSDIQIFPTIL